jgi:hypothetical protein
MPLERFLCLLPLLVAVLALTSCSTSGNAGQSSVEDQDFQVTLQKVQEAGLTPYWLGDRLTAGTTPFEVQPQPEILAVSGKPYGIELVYRGAESATGPFFLTSSVGAGGDASSGLEDVRRRALDVPGTKHEIVRVGEWDAELFSLPSAPRPVNQLKLIVEIGDVDIIARAYAGGSGIPGQDPNPLIDKDLLISVLAEHLRPYPE